jgi:hypothetical protein
MTTKAKKEINPFEIIAAPMRSNEIEWRVQSAKHGKTTIVPYMNNRSVMARFDEAFTPAGWQNSIQEGSSIMSAGYTPQYGYKHDKSAVINDFKHSYICGIGVKVNDEWVWKYDGAESTDIEPTKGGVSDSMKRTATQWGMGRDLYSYPRVIIVGEHKFIPARVKTRLAAMTEQIIAGKFTKEYVELNPND